VARGLSPLEPQAGAIRAARLLLHEIEQFLRQERTFGLETTLSGKTYLHIFVRALRLGYEIELHYLWLSSPAQAIARVRQRVRLGGHHVPESDIRRRFKRSLIIWSPIIFPWEPAGPFGTIAGFHQNSSHFPAYTIFKMCDS